MTDQELNDRLDAKKALVVHFSHHVLMNPEHPYYPEDLLRVLARNGEFPNSCCVLWPEHTMDLIGSVGVLLKPTCATIHSASVRDSGSLTWSDGTEGSLGDPLTVVSLEASFDVSPGSYNEWRVQGAVIEGIFVADPNNIWVKCEVEMGEGEWKTKTNTQKRITMDEVFATFPDSRIFTMNAQGKVEIPRP